MKLYNLKKVVLIILLSIISSAQLQAMSLRQLILIMFLCSPGTKTALSVAAQQNIVKIRCTIKDDEIIAWNRLAILPDGALVMQYPSLKLSADMRNKNHFGIEFPATDKF